MVQGAESLGAQADLIAEELSVKQVEFGPVEATELRVKPNLPLLGPKLGKELGPVRKKLEAGEFEELDGGRVRVDGHELSPEEVIVERRGKEGWAVAGEDGLTVALDLAIDPELELEGRAREAIHQVNTMRKEAGLEITDRIALTLPPELAEHEEWIARETLASRVEPGRRARDREGLADPLQPLDGAGKDVAERALVGRPRARRSRRAARSSPPSPARAARRRRP